MGKTSAEVKNRYNQKNYDRIGIMVKKGEKEVIQDRASALGKSVNAYICDLIATDLSKNSE